MSNPSLESLAPLLFDGIVLPIGSLSDAHRPVTDQCAAQAVLQRRPAAAQRLDQLHTGSALAG